MRFHRLALVIKRLIICSFNSCLVLKSSSLVMVLFNWSCDVFVKAGTPGHLRVLKLRAGEDSLSTKKNSRRYRLGLN
jgi:hypothetical protein